MGAKNGSEDVGKIVRITNILPGYGAWNSLYSAHTYLCALVCVYIHNPSVFSLSFFLFLFYFLSMIPLPPYFTFKEG